MDKEGYSVDLMSGPAYGVLVTPPAPPPCDRLNITFSTAGLDSLSILRLASGEVLGIHFI
jgi:hypothetical protein